MPSAFRSAGGAFSDQENMPAMPHIDAVYFSITASRF